VWAIAAIATAFLLALGLRASGVHWAFAWAASALVVPGYVLFAAFVLPYQGGGASMWPIAMFFGGLYGLAAGGVGTFIAAKLRPHKEEKA